MIVEFYDQKLLSGLANTDKLSGTQKLTTGNLDYTWENSSVPSATKVKDKAIIELSNDKVISKS